MQPFLLNHQLHFDAVVSQFRHNTNLTADFCYLAKSTASWWLVLIEIEPPDVPLFRANKLRLIPTAEFTERIAQIQDWRDTVSPESTQVIAQLDAIRKSLTRNVVHFRYVLIVGRDPIGREEEAWRRDE
jgi:antiviral defense system Shedu protein SduA